MLFNSLDFLIFLPAIFLLYYLIPAKYRWLLMLAASYYFYMCWRVEYILLIITSTLIDFYASKQMGRNGGEKGKNKKWLLLSIVSNLGLLFTFKYYGFAAESLTLIGEQFNFAMRFPALELLLPVGISFYTFQTLSYTIDVYKGREKPESHLGHFALYVAYFPQLVAGPIERYGRLAPQLKASHPFKFENLANGLRLILFGFFVKMVIADNLGPIVDSVYDNPASFSSLDIATAIMAYSFQIYGDFHGYSSIAIGAALLFGVKLMDNFKTPYLASGIREFWERWHISLSTWFRDYLYIPLGGNKVGIPRWAINILIVFVLSGIWHGANYTFAIWGAAYGLIYLIEHYFNKFLKIERCADKLSLRRLLLGLKTFALVSLIWVFFRSENIDQAQNIFSHLLSNTGKPSQLEFPTETFTWLMAFLILDLWLFNKRFDTAVGRLPFAVRWLIYSVLIFAVLAFAGVADHPFIYFQF